MDKLTPKQIEYFKSFILPPNENECMLWSGNIKPNGYGRIIFHKSSYYAHRLALWLVDKPIDSNLQALHKPIECHNKLCCNVNHLRWGTTSENAIDRKDDKTQFYAKGSKHGKSKLNENQVLKIKSFLKSNKFEISKISEMFNVSKACIYDIKSGRRWSHLSLDEFDEEIIANLPY